MLILRLIANLFERLYWTNGYSAHRERQAILRRGRWVQAEVLRGREFEEVWLESFDVFN